MNAINKICIALFLVMPRIVTKAYDIQVGGIYYNYIKEGTELAVTYYDDGYNYKPSLSGYKGRYAGNVIIPEEVTYMGRTRKVTGIGGFAFAKSENLRSVSIPSCITYINMNAFEFCSDLTEINIPEGISRIESQTFYGCSSLKSLHIPNSTTYIGASAFRDCGIQSIIIPDKVTCVNSGTFAACRQLSSISLPVSITEIGNSAFEFCESLTTLVIPNNVTTIDSYAFKGCSSLSSITIPNSVKKIGDYNVFGDCNSLTNIVSLMETPVPIAEKNDDYRRTFPLDIFYNATLYVPKGTIEIYKNTRGWKDFLFIEELKDDYNPSYEKCALPTIRYQHGKLIFDCATEGSTCQSTIADTDIASYSSNEVQLGITYNISVYATKPGYENSEVATATLCWIDQLPDMKGIAEDEDIVTEVKAMAVLIQSEDGTINVKGAEDGTNVSVYEVNGMLLGSTVSNNGQANIRTNMQSGSTAIVKIADRSVKVLIK